MSYIVDFSSKKYNDISDRVRITPTKRENYPISKIDDFCLKESITFSAGKKPYWVCMAIFKPMLAEEFAIFIKLPNAIF